MLLSRRVFVNKPFSLRYSLCQSPPPAVWSVSPRGLGDLLAKAPRRTHHMSLPSHHSDVYSLSSGSVSLQRSPSRLQIPAAPPLRFTWGALRALSPTGLQEWDSFQQHGKDGWGPCYTTRLTSGHYPWATTPPHNPAVNKSLIRNPEPICLLFEQEQSPRRGTLLRAIWFKNCFLMGSPFSIIWLPSP